SGAQWTGIAKNDFIRTDDASLRQQHLSYIQVVVAVPFPGHEQIVFVRTQTRELWAGLTKYELVAERCSIIGGIHYVQFVIAITLPPDVEPAVQRRYGRTLRSRIP